MNSKHRDAVMTAINAEWGLQSRIAEACNITRMAVSQWRHVPIHHIPIVAEITGRKPEEIRPDLYAIFKPKR